jgi:hypothetical protein
MPALPSAFTNLAALALGLMLAAGAATQAMAQQSCQEDFQRLSEKRTAQMNELNRIGKAGKGKIDPIAACPVARALVTVENTMLGYMTKNKEWCNIPDQVITNFQQVHGKNQTFATQACAAAVKFKQIQEQQRAAAANGGMAPQKLPSGPL